MKIKGKEKFARQLAALPAAMKDEIRKAIVTSAEEMVDLAKRFVPVKSGDLQKSIGFTMGAYRPESSNVRGVSTGAIDNARSAKSDAGLLATVHAGNAHAWYASLVEFGTAPHINQGKFAGSRHPGTAAQPFFFPTFRLTRKRAKSRITRAVNRGAKKAFSK